MESGKLTPQEKFESDNEYRHLVLTIEAMIHRANFTPSELREAVIYACIRYENYRVREIFVPKYPESVLTALETLQKFKHGE